MAGALEGIRVLDFSRFLAGPWCGLLLSDMGAEVLRVEMPGGEIDRFLGPFAPDGQALFVLMCARNKKGITLNLQHQKGQALLKELVKQSDVAVVNFSPPALKELGLDYPSLKDINPRIIGVYISGFGQYGPYSHRMGFDAIAQAFSGTMAYTGHPGNPPTRMAPPIFDYATAILAAYATMVALYHRERTGVGQMVDVSLVDTAVNLLAAIGMAAEYKIWGFLRPQIGNQSFYTYANTFQTKDGWVFIAVVSNRHWRRLVELVGREDLAQDPRFEDDMGRYKHRDLINAALDPWVAQRTSEEVVSLLTEEARLPCTKVNTIAEVLADPHIKARETVVELDYPGWGKLPAPGLTVKLSETPGRVEALGPRVGEHNQEVYSQLLGLTPGEILKLREEGVI